MFKKSKLLPENQLQMEQSELLMLPENIGDEARNQFLQYTAI
jgi:hypothetical protein